MSFEPRRGDEANSTEHSEELRAEQSRTTPAKLGRSDWRKLALGGLVVFFAGVLVHFTFFSWQTPSSADSAIESA